MNQDYQDKLSALDADIELKNSIPLDEEIVSSLAKEVEAIVQSAETGDVGAPFSDASLALLNEFKTQDLPGWMRLRERIKKAGVSVVELDKQMCRGDDSFPEKDQKTADKLIELARGNCKFVHDDQKRAFAIFRSSGARQVYGLQSSGFNDYLSHLYYTTHDRAPSDTAIKVALATLRGQAQFEGDLCEIHTRIAKTPEGYWLDLCNDAWQCVHITALGWSVVAGDGAPMFTRTSSMRDLPIPQPGGSLEDLWPLVNIPEQDRPMVLTWMLECLRPDTPHVVLELIGEQGSAKSTTQKFLRRLIDPNQADLRAAPKSVEDVWVGARNSHIVSFENLSHLQPAYQDALCVLATGGGYSTRTLFTNAEETIIDLRKPIVINGISVIVTAQDLLDRCLHIDLPTIQHRQLSSEIESRFEAAQPKLLGSLLDLFAKSIAMLPKVTIDPQHRPRMADFATFGEAVFRVNGHTEGEFLRRYNDKRRDGVHRTVDSSPVGAALLSYLDQNRTGWNGTLSELLDRLEKYRPQGEAWPRSAKGLADSLRRLAPALRLIGYECVSQPKQGGTIRWHIFQKPQVFKPCPASPASPESPHVSPSSRNESFGAVGHAGHAGHETERFLSKKNDENEFFEDSEEF